MSSVPGSAVLVLCFLLVGSKWDWSQRSSLETPRPSWMSQTKRTRRVIRPGEGPPQADIQQGQFDLQPRHSSGAVVRVHFGVSSSSTSHKNPSAMDSQPPKSQPAHPTRQWVQKFILLALFLQKKSGNGMGPFGLDQLPQTLEFWKNTRIFFF